MLRCKYVGTSALQPIRITVFPLIFPSNYTSVEFSLCRPTIHLYLAMSHSLRIGIVRRQPDSATPIAGPKRPLRPASASINPTFRYVQQTADKLPVKLPQRSDLICLCPFPLFCSFDIYSFFFLPPHKFPSSLHSPFTSSSSVLFRHIEIYFDRKKK